MPRPSRWASITPARRGGWAGRDVLMAASQSARSSPAHRGWSRFDQAKTTSSPNRRPMCRSSGRLGPVANHHVHIALGQVGVVMRTGRQSGISPWAQRGLSLDTGRPAGVSKRVQVVAGRHAKRAVADAAGQNPIQKTGPPPSRMAQVAPPCAGQRQQGIMLAPDRPQQRLPARSRSVERCRHRRLVHAQADGGPDTLFSEHGCKTLRDGGLSCRKGRGLS